MKKTTLILAIALMTTVPFFASASTVSLTSGTTGDNWETTYGMVNFEKESDRIVVELNGSELFSVKPEWEILGEVTFLNKNKSFSFDINTAVVDPSNVSIYSIVDGVKTIVK